MFNPFSRKSKTGRLLTIKIAGMHCSSCSMNIDGALEDIPGVLEAKTSYARSSTQVRYDEAVVTAEELEKVIKKLGYEITK